MTLSDEQKDKQKSRRRCCLFFSCKSGMVCARAGGRLWGVSLKSFCDWGKIKKLNIWIEKIRSRQEVQDGGKRIR